MKHVALVCCLFSASIARADDPPVGVRLETSEPKLLVPNRPLRRRVGIGLIIGAAVSVALGATFVGLAKGANNDVFAGKQYHPHEETLRDHYQIVDATFFMASIATFVPGMVLIWDR